MTMAMQAFPTKPTGPKVLRIGIIQSGKIVEERIVRGRETVTVGSSEKNHFVVQGEGVPSSFELFQRVGDDYILNFTDQMSGRVGLPGGVQDLDRMREGGAARNAGAHWQIKLSDTSRGKVVIAATTLLFQFVFLPPAQPRPQLPAAARAGFVRSIDWLFTTFMVFTFMTMFGFIVYLENADWPLASGITLVPAEFAEIVFEEPSPPPEETDDAEESPSEDKTVAPDEKPKPEPKQPTQRPDNQRDEAATAQKTARIALEASRAAEALIVGALSGAVDGALIDVLAGGAVPGNARDVLEQAEGVGVATSASGTLREHSGGGTGSGQTLASLSARGGPGTTAAQDEGRKVVEEAVRGRIDLGSGGGDIAGSGDFDATLVVQKIKAQISAIRSCYERELKSNPTLAGKVTIQFTIEERGTVSGVKVSDNTTGSPPVGTCVANAIQRFRFNPGPDGGSVTFSYPFVFAPQG